MYKLFLTIRYLTRKKIVIFPILVVWLCLMMMIIVTSIMGGFVDRVREANRDLLGDVVISNQAGSGWPYYQELQDALKGSFSKEIAATTPVVRGYGLMNLPAFNQTFFAQITGIDPASRSKVSRFHDTLYRQYIAPTNAIDDLAPALPADTLQLQRYARGLFDAANKRYLTASEAEMKILPPDFLGGPMPPEKNHPNYWWLLGLPVVGVMIGLKLRKRPNRPSVFDWFSAVAIFGGGTLLLSVGFFFPVIFPHNYELAEDNASQARAAADRAWATYRTTDELPLGATFKDRQQLVDLLVPKYPSFNVPEPGVAPGLAAASATQPADPDAPDGCIVGVQFPGMFERDKRGNFDRSLDTGDLKALLTVVPIGERGAAQTRSAITGRFVIVDDSYTGVYDVDSTYVYAPFEKVQSMAGMRSEAPPGTPDWFPPRCNEVLIKLAGSPSANETRILRARIDQFVQQFVIAHPGMSPNGRGLDVQTWDEKQARYLGAVQNEKNMMTFILGLMSLVVLVVVFLIFYMIVRDKTRDIGIIKAVGGSELGVAGIFLTYGLFIGIVGGILGVISGIEFVTHTNQIHEWIHTVTGLTIWDRSVYLFDRIPDEYNPYEVAFYFLASLIAGVIGALIPAIVAAAEDPVKAVRYE